MNAGGHRYWPCMLAALVTPWSTAHAEPAPTTADTTLTTEVWEDPGVPLDPVWNVLLLPERLIEAMFLPVGTAVSVVETYALDQRVVDLLTFGNFKITPKIAFGFPDGLGLGAKLTGEGLVGGDSRFDLGGKVRDNRDYDLKGRYRQTFARLEGRMIDVVSEYEVDSNEPYYGLGGETDDDDRRVLRTEIFDIGGAIDLSALGDLLFTGRFLVGFSHQRLLAGSDPGRTPVGEPGDSVAPPPGFGETLNFPRLGLEIKYDTRDREGRPTRGTLAHLDASLTTDVSGNDLSSVRSTFTVQQYIPVLPLYRVIVLTAGLGGTRPLEDDAQVPYHERITLGRDNFLRGYRRDRFKGRYGWWASAQYQFPLGEYMNSDVALSAALFYDIGRVADEAADLVTGPIRQSYGLGFGIAHTSTSVVSASVARSEEGIEFVFAGGLEL